MKKHTAEELKSMSLKEIEAYYEKLHKFHATKELNPIFL